MCGIAGQVFGARTDSSVLRQNASAMNARQRHRGPDASGVWVAESGRGALAFARLSIQDLSAAANQPIFANRGRVDGRRERLKGSGDAGESEQQGAHGRHDGERTEGLLPLYGPSRHHDRGDAKQNDSRQ